MATLTPGGSASVGGGNTPLSFPLLPQGWPLTVIPGSDSVSGENLPQNPNPASTAQAAYVKQALIESSESNNRLV